jgi:hypothetical protein
MASAIKTNAGLAPQPTGLALRLVMMRQISWQSNQLATERLRLASSANLSVFAIYTIAKRLRIKQHSNAIKLDRLARL